VHQNQGRDYEPCSLKQSSRPAEEQSPDHFERPWCVQLRVDESITGWGTILIGMNSPITPQGTLIYTKHKRVLLRDIGKNELWLQNQISEDPSILGLGDLSVYKKEKVQPSGGRLDFMLRDSNTVPETMYEVEVMLGATDESHIIRTIEYWDVESRSVQYRDLEHKAVIVAEGITNRFFNVIWLLSRSLPIIALQLNAIIVDDKLLLHFVKVLDIYETPGVAKEQESAGPVNREWWLKQAPEGMKTVDALIKAIVSQEIDPKVSYNTAVISLGNEKCWNILIINPTKKGPSRVYFNQLGNEADSEREKIQDEWENSGVADVAAHPNGNVSVKVTADFIEQHSDFVAKQIKHIFELCDH
jgi:hypothetical protein